MLRQSQAPFSYQASRRPDNVSLLTSGRAGEIIPLTAGPLFRGDSASGNILIEATLAEMPRPIENLVIMRGQAWVVPRPAFPRFEGVSEYVHSYSETDITKQGAAARTPPSLFDTVASGAIAAFEASEFCRALGLTLRAGVEVNTDYVDAYNLICNFRLAAHSSKMARYSYYGEDAVTSLELKPAFWPVNRMHNVVPDYEVALVKGSLELDVIAGSAPVSGLGKSTQTFGGTSVSAYETGGTAAVTYAKSAGSNTVDGLQIEEDPNNPGFPNILAEMAGQTISTSLADIDKARLTEAMAKARAAMAGVNFSGFNPDDVIVAQLMQGFTVPPEMFQRPMLLDSQTAVFGMTERPATDAANLDDSVTTGKATIRLSMNIPRMDYGAVYMTTAEVGPERLYERQGDPYQYATSPSDLPDATRDVQNTLPVDFVPNWRVDAKHASPDDLFGYEPMNAKHRREFTRLGGEYRQLTPGVNNTTARTAIWQVNIQDPVLNSDHWLMPHPFPQDVFSLPSSDVVTFSVNQQLAITGITQFGDDLVEDNNEYADTAAEGAA